MDEAVRLFEKHAQLNVWRQADEALNMLRDAMPGFSYEAVLIKAVTINSLYYTRVLAIQPVAGHLASVLSSDPPRPAGPELVESMAGDKPRRISFASKFAHFFLENDPYPIYDSYARRMIAKHTGVSEESLRKSYRVYVDTFKLLATRLEIYSDQRRLDRYLWIQGQYEEYKKEKARAQRLAQDGVSPTPGEIRGRGPRASNISGDLRKIFDCGVWPPKDRQA